MSILILETLVKILRMKLLTDLLDHHKWVPHSSAAFTNDKTNIFVPIYLSPESISELQVAERVVINY